MRQRTALNDFAKEVAKRRQDHPELRTLIENNPVGDSQSKGLIEIAVRALEGLTRTLKIDLEQNIQAKVSAEAQSSAG